MAYFPKASSASQIRSRFQPTDRPSTIAPILDPQNASKPVIPWSSAFQDTNYPARQDDFAAAPIPPEPESLSDAYLHPVLARNERLRLTMLWYYTRDFLKDQDLLQRLADKVQAAEHAVDWAEFAIIGLLDHNAYHRLATRNLPLANLPRRESTCAHTINQPPRTAFILPNMAEDWRFKDSPHVKIGGLRAYAGVPLSLETEFGDTVALGSLCVASNTPSEGLTRQQYVELTQLADWVVVDLIHCARIRRQQERHQMVELISQVKDKVRENESEEPILSALKTTFPACRINIQACHTLQIVVEGRAAIPVSEFHDGLWENDALVDKFLTSGNHEDLVGPEALRVIAIRCENTVIPTFLTVATHDFRRIFDDVDSWFVQSCAIMLSRIWQVRLLKEAMRAKEKFLRGITHQLRTPIHGILGSADLLREELESQTYSPTHYTPPPITPLASTKAPDVVSPMTYINTIRSSARDLISTVNSMLTLNRWEDVARSERVDTLHTLDELESGLSDQVSKALSGDARYKSSIIFRSDYNDFGDSIYIDLRLLTDCLLPVVLNAVQSAPTGTVVICLSAGLGVNDLIVDVHDDGCGISPEDFHRIWEAHEKIDSHSTGAGLGLTLAAKFATLLNGSIKLVSSQVNHGSHFRATFQDVTFACSLKAARRASSISHSSHKGFHKLDTKVPTSFICQHFTDFLTERGYAEEPRSDRTILLIDGCPDAWLRSTIFSEIPPNQVAIYLAGSSESYDDTDIWLPNVIPVRSPFLSSTFRQALQRAEEMMAEPRVQSIPIPIRSATQTQPAISQIDSPPQASKRRRVSRDDDEYVGLGTVNGQLIPTKALSGVQSVLVAGVDSLQIANQTEIQPLPIFSRPSPQPVTLIVDDNAVNLRIMQMYCNKRKLPQLSAVDGQKAVDQFIQRRSVDASAVELIFMDLQMPVMDGIEATKKIRELEKLNNWPKSVIFIITGQDSQSDRSDAEQAGADGYFVKPVSIKLLDHGIKELFPDFSPP